MKHDKIVNIDLGSLEELACRRHCLALLCMLLASLLPPSHALQLGLVLRGEAIQSGHHDLSIIANTLRERGHDVRPIAAAGQDSPDWEAAITKPERLYPPCDALLAAGQGAIEVADYAAHFGTPMVRFIPDSSSAAPDEPAFQPHREQPAVLVFANGRDAERFSYVEEAPRLVLPLEATSNSSASAFAELDIALQAAVAAQPRPGCIAPADQGSGAALTPPRMEAEGSQAPLLGLVMIVKSENATLATTLASIKGDIDYWTIVDTGSTDGTQETIDAAMAGLPGQRLTQDFVDFSTTRNWALQAHGQRTQYAFMLDADFEVRGGWRLRLAAQRLARECARRSVAQCPKGLMVWFQLGETGFFSNRVFPTDGLGTKEGWHYVYPVHEVPAHDGLRYLNVHVVDDVVKLDGVTVKDLPISHNKSPDRWRKMDLPLLLKEHQSNPADTRTVFYLAQTYELIEDTETALAMYQRRIRMGGWQQEVFESHFRRGRIKHRRLQAHPHLDPANDTSLDPAPDLLAALAVSPQRAEPLMFLSWHAEWLRDHWCPRDRDPPVCRLQQEVAAYNYARQAADKPFPRGDTLFADTAVYEHLAQERLAITAWYVARQLSDAFEVGREAAEKLLRRFPGDERRRTNLEWYEKLASGVV